jgi:hypothetical protein
LQRARDDDQRIEPNCIHVLVLFELSAEH